MAARLPCDFSAFNRKNEMKRTTSAENKTLVLEAFDTLFNKRDYVAAERYWSSNYLQHSAHIEPGRNGLFSLIKSLPPTLKYEPGLIVAEGEFVIVHGRFSGHGQPKNWIAADVVRIADGVLVEHWDVIEDEASRAESKSGLPMFGADFSERASTTCIANQAYRAVKTLIMQTLGSNAPSLNYADRRKGPCGQMRRFLGCVRTVAVWTYEAPYAAVAAIKDHVAFYPDRVDAIDEQLA